jgi:hypothetical protein
MAAKAGTVSTAAADSFQQPIVYLLHDLTKSEDFD